MDPIALTSLHRFFFCAPPILWCKWIVGTSFQSNWPAYFYFDGFVTVHAKMSPWSRKTYHHKDLGKNLKKCLQSPMFDLRKWEQKRWKTTDTTLTTALQHNLSLPYFRVHRREITVEISCDGFYRTGIRPDVSQFAVNMASFVAHIRCHKSFETLEARLGYKFKDKSLLHVSRSLFSQCFKRFPWMKRLVYLILKSLIWLLLFDSINGISDYWLVYYLF